MRFTLSLLTLLLVCTFGYAQHKVSGVVKDQSGETIPGAFVKIVGTTQGTSTDFDGNYALDAKKDASLEFSSMGYVSQRIAVNDRTQLDVTLQAETTSLDEVVVTAVGIKQQKKRIGYATQQISSNVIEQANAINLGNALSGQVAGLYVTNPTGLFQAPSFQLRGKKPLIVVDGIPIESDMFDLPNDDVESINVLKGTSASALYGARGKNGAILISTKKATKEGLEVKVSALTMATAGFTVFPKTQNQYGSGTNGKYEFWDGAGPTDGDMTWGPKFVPGLLVKQWNSPIRNIKTGEITPWWGDVTGTIYDDRSKYERVATPFVQHDNLKNFLRTGIVAKADFSIAYKGKRSNTYFSGNYANQRGQVPNTSVTIGGLNFSNMYDLSDNLKLQSSLNYTKVYSPNYPRYGYGPKNHMYTIMLWMSDDVDIKELKEHLYRPDQDGYRQANYNYAWYNNPYFMANEMTQKHDRDVLNGQMKLIWDISPNFTLQGRTSARMQTIFEDQRVPKSYRNYGDSRDGDYKNWNTRKMSVDADMLASYNQAFGRNFNLTVNAGAATFYNRFQQEYQSTDGLIVPWVYSLNNTKGPVKASNNVSERAINSLYASADLDYRGAFFLTLTGRNDWASTLPAGNNSYFYPSASLSTLVSEYVKMPSMIDFLKLYTSWAEVSNDLSPYSISASYRNGVMYGANPSVSYPSNLVNPNIKPEKSTSYEAGLSTSVFKNRMNFDLTYYRVIDQNQIISFPTSEAAGFTGRLVNGNEFTTNGFELVLGVRAIKTKNFAWSFNTNWTRSVRRLTDIYGGANKFGNLVKGDRADAIYNTVWQKSATGQLILDAKRDEKDPKKILDVSPVIDAYPSNIGNQDPTYKFGFQNTFNIYGFTMNMDFDGVIGGKLISTTHQKMWWAGKHPKSVTWRDAQYAAGAPVYVPQGVIVTGGKLVRDVNGNIVSDTRTYAQNTTAVDWQTWSQNYPYRAAVTTEESKEFANTFDRSYMKLRRLSVSYNIAKLIGLKGVKTLNLTAFGENLFVLKKIPYIDPDFGASDGDLQDPSARYLGVSAAIKF